MPEQIPTFEEWIESKPAIIYGPGEREWMDWKRHGVPQNTPSKVVLDLTVQKESVQ